MGLDRSIVKLSNRPLSDILVGMNGVPHRTLFVWGVSVGVLARDIIYCIAVIPRI